MRFALVGTGFGAVHLGWLSGCPGLTVEVVCYEKNRARATDLAETFRIARTSDDPFAVMAADALTDIDLGALVRAHAEHDWIATLAVKRVSDTSEYGVVVTGSDGRVGGFQEKPDPAEALSDHVWGRTLSAETLGSVSRVAPGNLPPVASRVLGLILAGPEMQSR